MAALPPIVIRFRLKSPGGERSGAFIFSIGSSPGSYLLKPLPASGKSAFYNSAFTDKYLFLIFNFFCRGLGHC